MFLAGTGAYGSVPDVCRAAIRETDSIAPEVTEAVLYEKRHKIYQALYPALKGICGGIAEL